MTRDEMRSLLAAISALVPGDDVVIIGSQSVLGAFDEQQLPSAATLSREADFFVRNDVGGGKTDRVDAIIGESSSFHDANDFYAQGVGPETATLVPGWDDRLVRWPLPGGGSAYFLDPHDLALAKLDAWRTKDRAFVAALLTEGLLDPEVLRARLAQLPASPLSVERVRDWLAKQ